MRRRVEKIKEKIVLTAKRLYEKIVRNKVITKNVVYRNESNANAEITAEANRIQGKKRSELSKYRVCADEKNWQPRGEV